MRRFNTEHKQNVISSNAPNEIKGLVRKCLKTFEIGNLRAPIALLMVSEQLMYYPRLKDHQFGLKPVT